MTIFQIIGNQLVRKNFDIEMPRFMYDLTNNHLICFRSMCAYFISQF